MKLKAMLAIGVVVVQILAGCATLLRDPVTERVAVTQHCSGNEWYSTHSVAVLPIPFVAFFVPHVTIGGVDTGEVLEACGPGQLINRQVTRNFAVCIPSGFLTYMISLGIWGYCPTHVSFEADIVTR